MNPEYQRVDKGPMFRRQLRPSRLHCKKNWAYLELGRTIGAYEGLELEGSALQGACINPTIILRYLEPLGRS